MITINEIIKRIHGLQSAGEQYFDEGLFPAYRTNSMIGYIRPDTTVFFSAIIAFTLQNLKPLLNNINQQLIDEIAEEVIKNYPKFQNKDGLKTYNFWKTIPSRHFPNGYIFKHFDHFRIPDDTDDTALIYLTSTPTPEECLWLKDKLSQHANLTKQKVKNTYPEYRSLKAYSTWFGKNMYIEFDACVLANVLYFVHQYRLPLNQHDKDAIRYIIAIVESNRYLSEPFRCAHQYPRTSLIIYHVARLISAFQITDLDIIKEKLIGDIKHLLASPQPVMEKLILNIALMRLGEHPVDTHLEIEPTKDFKDFHFFIAGLLTAYEYKWLYRVASLPLFHIRWQCEAHCWTLIAEYLTLKQKVYNI